MFIHTKELAMQLKQSLQSLVDSAKTEGAIISETSATVMVSAIGATQWDSSPRLMIFADNTAIVINPDNTRRRLRTVKSMKEVVGLANA